MNEIIEAKYEKKYEEMKTFQKKKGLFSCFYQLTPVRAATIRHEFPL